TIIMLTALEASAQSRVSGAVDETSRAETSGTITGRVLNESGQPIANAVVMIRAAAGRARLTLTTTNRSDGDFLIESFWRQRSILFGRKSRPTPPPVVIQMVINRITIASATRQH